MKIGSVYSVVGQYNMQRTEAVQPRPKACAQMDKVELSAGAQLFTEALSQLKQQMQAEPPEYAAKALSVMNRISSGAYFVDTGDILDKLLA